VDESVFPDDMVLTPLRIYTSILFKASILTCAATSMTWCFCTAAASLLSACCGNDKPSNLPPGPTSGRKRSVVLLFLSICFALAFQFGVAPFFVDSSIDNFVRDSWLDGCEKYDATAELQKSCAGNNGNFRVAAATTLFFVLAAAAAICKQTANREAWPAKFVLYLFLVGATVVIPSDPVFSEVYFHIALST
jgi:Serine incorporator (Serinc)